MTIYCCACKSEMTQGLSNRLSYRAPLAQLPMKSALALLREWGLAEVYKHIPGAGDAHSIFRRECASWSAAGDSPDWCGLRAAGVQR